jgi:hypothetical protein
MRRLIAPLAVFVTLIGVALPAFALTPVHLWSQRFGAAGADFEGAIAIDASGNVTIAGSFSNTVDFGGGGSGLVSAGNTDIFIAKYNSLGVHQWSKRIGGTGDDAALGLALDGSGNPIITGYHSGSVDFGGGVLPNFGGHDFFVAKYVGTGTYQWALGFGSTPTDEGHAVVCDGMANVYVTGVFSMNTTFGGGTLMSAGGTDIVLAKYNTAGIHQWSQRFGGATPDAGEGLALDASGNVLLTGSFQGTANFGGGVFNGVGSKDAVLAKYNSSGTHQWSKQFGSTLDDVGQSVTTDASGNVFTTGFFSGSADFGGGALVPQGASALFIAKYNSAGAHQWSQRAAGMGTSTGRSVALDNAGNVLLTGSFTSVANFGGSNLFTAGSDDVFIAKYTTAGVHKWSFSYGSNSTDAGVGVVTDASRNIFLAGNFNATINLGGSNLVSAGGNDVFLARFAREPQQPIIRTITDIGNDQGRQVLINFTASGDDQLGSPTTITQYEAYRKVASPPPSVSGMDQLSTAQLLAEGWTQVGAVAAHGETGYTMVAPTIGDSTIAFGQYRSTFYVRAASASPYTFFDSPADSGYSKDNLAPAVPQNFVFNAGDLSWNESTAADFDYFTVYGANTDNFGTATVVDYSVAPDMDVTASPYVYYYVTATDFSGNEGKPAKINTLSGVGGTPSSYVLSVSNYPNPFNPRTRVSYTVPSRGHVNVRVFDAHGAHVATLFDGERNMGAYSVDWDGRTTDAAVAASGVYFARIEHNGATRTKKMVLLK